MSTKTQIKKIENLNHLISECEAYNGVPEGQIIMLPTGDGMCLDFLQSPELPVMLAIEIHKKLGKYNKARIPSETIRVRIGIHSGACFVVKDIQGNKNIWGLASYLPVELWI